MEPHVQCSLRTPIGKVLLAASPCGLVFLCFEEFRKNYVDDIDKLASFWTRSEDKEKISCHLRLAQLALRHYFSGDTRQLKSICPAPEGTPFQKKVWQTMRQIRPGTTMSYGELARRSGYPGAARAVGTACRDNPLPLVVPCHRVIGSNGKLIGYSAGLWRKEYLLTHESAV